MIAWGQTSTYDYHPIMSDTSPTRLPPLTCQRDAFSLPPDVCYLNSAYMGPLPQAVRLATERALSARTVPVDLTSGDFFAPAEAARRACAALVSLQPDRSCNVGVSREGARRRGWRMKPTAAAGHCSCEGDFR